MSIYLKQFGVHAKGAIDALIADRDSADKSLQGDLETAVDAKDSRINGASADHATELSSAASSCASAVTQANTDLAAKVANTLSNANAVAGGADDIAEAVADLASNVSVVQNSIDDEQKEIAGLLQTHETEAGDYAGFAASFDTAFSGGGAV